MELGRPSAPIATCQEQVRNIVIFFPTELVAYAKGALVVEKGETAKIKTNVRAGGGNFGHIGGGGPVGPPG